MHFYKAMYILNGFGANVIHATLQSISNLYHCFHSLCISEWLGSTKWALSVAISKATYMTHFPAARSQRRMFAHEFHANRARHFVRLRISFFWSFQPQHAIEANLLVLRNDLLAAATQLCRYCFLKNFCHTWYDIRFVHARFHIFGH